MKLKTHRSTIYAWLRAHQGHLIKKRADSGVARTDVPLDVLKQIFALSIRYGYSARRALKKAEKDGLIQPGAMSARTYQRQLKAYKIRPNIDLTPPHNMRGKSAHTRIAQPTSVRFEALYPNQVHQFDASQIKPWMIRHDSPGIVRFEPDKGPNRGDENRNHPRINLFVAVDDCTRCVYARLYTSKGLEVWLDFMFRVWSPGKTESPLQGTPKTLYSDTDSATKGGAFGRLMDDLEIDFHAHEVGNPKGKGKVENGIKYIKALIQQDLLAELDQRGQVTLDEANEILAEIVFEKNYELKHSTTGRLPGEHYLEEVGMVRSLPPESELYRYFWDCWSVKLYSDLTVRLHGVRYQISQKDPHLYRIIQKYLNEKIELWAHKDKSRRMELGIMLDGEMHIIEAKQAEPHAAGEYRAIRRTEAEKIIDEVYEMDLSFDPRAASGRPAPAAPNIAPLPTPPPPQKIITRTHAKVQLRQTRVAYNDADIETIFGDQDEIPENVYLERSRYLGDA